MLGAKSRERLFKDEERSMEISPFLSGRGFYYKE
jgi:hypothetical protein